MATTTIYRYDTLRVCQPGQRFWWGITLRDDNRENVFSATAHLPHSGYVERSVTIEETAIDSHTGYLYGDKESYWLRLRNSGSKSWSQLKINVCIIAD